MPVDRERIHSLYWKFLAPGVILSGAFPREDHIFPSFSRMSHYQCRGEPMCSPMVF